MLARVQQATIKPVIAAVATGTLVHAEECGIYARLPAWGYQHKTVCHGRGEYARDEDGDGFCEVHVNTIEGFWSLLRSWPCRNLHDKSANLKNVWIQSTPPCPVGPSRNWGSGCDRHRRAWFKTGGLWVTPKVARAAPTKGFHVSRVTRI